MSNREEKINFKDLQSLLQKGLNNDVQVLNVNATKFLPVGENYCSTMVKIDAIICRSNSTTKEKLYLVAKTIDKSEEPILDWKIAFKKEVFMYSEVIPAYRELEKKMGIQECELFDILPKYYSHRYSLKYDDVLDEDSVLLMENLKVQGFYTGNRYTGK